MNLIDAAIDVGVKKLVALSTDKACKPVNLYGATKLASDKLFIASNAYSGDTGTLFSVVRYGNVMGSRGSVIPFFLKNKESSSLPITDKRMTRFMMTLEQSVSLVWHAFEDMVGGEIYVKKNPSMKVTEIASAISPEASHEIIGIRPGEKLHEEMISSEDSMFTYEYKNHFKILPLINNSHNDKKRIKDGIKVKEGFSYDSFNNGDWMSKEILLNWVQKNYPEYNK